ncbi:MAG: alpha/beta fold hydrolase [Candidatus Eisenbacteria bacterium]|nr:alpha/beta fold hydrolase [Candidatus Eisenbacteria bacterium]
MPGPAPKEPGHGPTAGEPRLVTLTKEETMARSRLRKIGANDLFRLELPNSPTLSPDGRYAAFTVKRTLFKKNKYASDIHVAALRSGRTRRLTTGESMDTAPAWSPNGRWIAFISNRDQKPQIWILPTHGGEARQLTKLEGGPIRQLSWSPDSRRILFGHRIQKKEDPKEKKTRPTYKHITRLVHKLDGDGYWPKERWHLWTVTVPGGRTRQITSGPDDDWDGVWSPDGKRIAFVSNRLEDADWHPENSDIFIVNDRGQRLRQVTQLFGTTENPAWSADGKTIYYMGNFAPDGEWNQYPTHIYRIPAGGGEVVDLTPELDYWPMNMVVSDTAQAGHGSVLLPFQDGEDERLAFFVNIHGGCRLYSMSTRGGPARPEWKQNVNVLAVSANRDGRLAAVAAATMMDVGDIYRVPLDGSGRVRRLTQLNRTVFDSLDLSEPEEMEFRNGRTRIQGWVLKPPGFQPQRKYPMLLEVHGGPMTQYGYTFFHEMHLLAAKGYVVVFPNPRGSDGFGTRFRSCIDARWGTVDYDDCMAVVDVMERKRYVDKSRMGILGGSYGGFMTTWAVGHTDRFKAAVTQRQASNMWTMFGSSDFGFYRAYKYRAYPWQRPMTYLKASPNFYAGNINTPLLIIHSENDYRCPLAQSEELFTSLKLQKKTVELVQFEGESHGLSRGGKPMNRLERLNRIVDWFERYL